MTQEQNLALAQQMYLSQKKDVTIYVLLALFLGSFGVHHFYLGRNTAAILHLVFFITFIPTVLSIAHAINSRKAVGARNRELALAIATTFNVPADSLVRMAAL